MTTRQKPTKGTFAIGVFLDYATYYREDRHVKAIANLRGTGLFYFPLDNKLFLGCKDWVRDGNRHDLSDLAEWVAFRIHSSENPLITFMASNYPDKIRGVDWTYECSTYFIPNISK